MGFSPSGYCVLWLVGSLILLKVKFNKYYEKR